MLKIWNRFLRLPKLRSVYRRLFPARVTCRAAGAGDAAAVARLMEPLFPASARNEALPSAERMLSETARAGAEYRVAVHGREILAGCQVGPLLRSAGFDGCWILGLWVLPLTRGRGIGETLIRHVIDTARERGEPGLYCHIVSTNAASLRLFHKLGFGPAPSDVQRRIEEKFGSAFEEGSQIRAYYLDLRIGPSSP